MSGTLILIFIFVVVLLAAALGFYCHFCFGESGGRSLQVMEPGVSYAAPVVAVIPKRKCKCGDKFKGLCKNCEGEDFVGSDGGVRGPPDYTKFGGDKGLSLGDNDTGNPLESLVRQDNTALTIENASANTTVGYSSDYY